MAKVRARAETGLLYLDFFYRSQRCREQTALKDTPGNRRICERLLAKVEKDIKQGQFDYAATFPGSPRAERFASMDASVTPLPAPAQPGQARPVANSPCPTFQVFADTWFTEREPQWRRSYSSNVREILERELKPRFGDLPLDRIGKPEVLAYRAELAKRPGRRGCLTASRINKIVCILRQVLNEAADRFDLLPAFRGIKSLRVPKSDVQPFSLDEVNRVLQAVRPDYRNYLITRFYTGMRSGEVNGLKWQYVDFERGQILVRETLVAGELERGAKTDSSVRDIPMLPMVRRALEEQLRAREPDCPWVFATRGGNPIDANNFANRVWYPLLRYLDLAPRRPYQTRHTAATLMLASGEAPEWVARVLGHSNTEILFKVYSRFVPNATRLDGRAFAGLVSEGAMEPTQATSPQAAQGTAGLIAQLAELPPDALKALLALANKAS